LKISLVIQSVTISEACTCSLKQGLTSDNQDACNKQFREYFKYNITKIVLQQYILVFCDGVAEERYKRQKDLIQNLVQS
jgi:hypothetical protein